MKQLRDTIIFDLDGTLLNTLEDLADSTNAILTQHQFPTHSVDEIRQMVGNGIGVLLEKAIPQGRTNPAYNDCLQEFQVYYAAHMQDKTKPFPGILELLEQLANQGFLLAVVSNKFDAAVKALCLDYFGSRIPVAIGESASIARKPAPDTVYEAIHQLSSSAERSIYVGDSEVDIATAQNAGIPCVSVTWGFRSREYLISQGGCHLAATMEELAEQLRTLGDYGTAL